MVTCQIDSADWEAYKPWLRLLPSHEAAGLPISTFSDAELKACGDPGAIREAQNIRDMIAAAAEVQSICWGVEYALASGHLD